MEHPMSRKNGCFFEKVAQEFERVAAVTRGARRTKDVGTPDRLAVLAGSIRVDCGCKVATGPDEEKPASSSNGVGATK
jgi:hypothetical protein